MAARESKRVLNLIIDTDVGSDDAMAIILCCAAQQKGDANIWGITCVHGNTALSNVCANTVKTLHTMGRLDVSAVRTYKHK
jgi:inosine-uridine nucleoside N-ribohydrolase